MIKNFNEAEKLVREYDELTSLEKELKNVNNIIGVIHANSDSPGINYSTYSDFIKSFILKALEKRISEIIKN